MHYSTLLICLVYRRIITQQECTTFVCVRQSTELKTLSKSHLETQNYCKGILQTDAKSLVTQDCKVQSQSFESAFWKYWRGVIFTRRWRRSDSDLYLDLLNAFLTSSSSLSKNTVVNSGTSVCSRLHQPLMSDRLPPDQSNTRVGLDTPLFFLYKQ